MVLYFFTGHFLFQECVSNNRGVVYDLIASHGDVEDMVFFAVLMRGKNHFKKIAFSHVV